MNADRVARFWAKVDKDGPTGCWLWTASVDRHGYGQFRAERRSPVKAHRFSYELCVGPIPLGLQLDHLCRVTGCVNPAHLEPVTSRENVLRGMAGAQFTSRTHCPQGHPYDDTNTYTDPAGHRKCRACRLVRKRAYNARRFNPTPSRWRAA